MAWVVSLNHASKLLCKLLSISSKANNSTCIRPTGLNTHLSFNAIGFAAVTTGSPGDGVGPEASRLGLSHWAGPSVTGSAKVSQSFYGGIIIMIPTKGKPVPLAWQFIYKLGEVTRVTSTILPDMGRKYVTVA